MDGSADPGYGKQNFDWKEKNDDVHISLNGLLIKIFIFTTVSVKIILNLMIFN